MTKKYLRLMRQLRNFSGKAKQPPFEVEYFYWQLHSILKSLESVPPPHSDDKEMNEKLTLILNELATLATAVQKILSLSQADQPSN